MIERENLGEFFHTALRKCCDSDPTTMAYFLIRRMKKSWGFSLDLLFFHVKAAATAEECAEIMLGLEARTHGLSFLGFPEVLTEPYQKLSRKGQENVDILMCAFRMFSKTDWTNAFSYSFYVEDES